MGSQRTCGENTLNSTTHSHSLPPVPPRPYHHLILDPLCSLATPLTGTLLLEDDGATTTKHRSSWPSETSYTWEFGLWLEHLWMPARLMSA